MTRLFALTTILLLLTACAPTPAPRTDPTAGALALSGVEGTLAEVTATQTWTPVTPTHTASPSPVPTPSRTAAISEVEPMVEARASASTDFSIASAGQALPVGGEARTGEEGRARLDLAPDGTIIRLAPNTHFTLAKLEDAPGNPFTLLELFFGKLFILLSGGELQAQTPSGVASVRGSMMSVSFDPQTNTMTVTCLEGHCSLRNDKGIIELIAGQAADIRDGILSREPRLLSDQELLDWLDYVPELNDFPDVLKNFRDRFENLSQRTPRPRRTPRPFP